jgi:magnesium transporter
MLHDLLRPEIHELIENRKWSALRDVLNSWQIPEIAELIIELDKSDRVILYRLLHRDISADVFSYMDYDERVSLLYDLTDKETKELLADLSPDDRTELLEELPAKVTRTLMNLLEPEDLKEARALLGYPEDSIGRKMTPDFVAVRSEWTVGKALNHIRKFGKDSETIYRIYVTDKAGKLLDDILLRNIIIADENKLVSSLMDYHVTSVPAFEDQEQAVRIMEKYDLFAIPVVDSNGMLVGIVTFDDMYDISEEEATEDFQKIGGMAPVDQSYLSAGVKKMWSKRFPWLLVLLFTNFITAALILHFEPLLSQLVILTAFMPMLLGTGGNTGTQSATLVIRALSIEEIDLSDWWRVFLKELFVGLLLGASLGIFAYIRGLFSEEQSVSIPLILGLSMIAVILWANIVGSLLPILIKKVKLDPAVVSNPLISTLTDVSGIIIYFNIAALFI